MATTVDRKGKEQKFDGILGMALRAPWPDNDGPEAPMSRAALEPRRAFSFYMYDDQQIEGVAGYGGEVNKSCN